MKVDFIIVGCGLAGIAFCQELRKAKKSYIVFDDDSQHSSLVAAGMYNPVILKRFTEVWLAKEQLLLALPVYRELEQLLDVKLDYKLKIFRRFSSIEEQNMWFTATDNSNLTPFLSTKLVKNCNTAIDAPLGFGEVLQTGRIDTNALISGYKSYLKANNQLTDSRFLYAKLETNQEGLVYQDIQAKHIVFCEGFGLTQNPYFDYLPLKPVKGELITIKAPELKIDYILKSSVFVVPESESFYTVGATYNWIDKSNTTTQAGKEELVKKLKAFMKCDFEVVNQVAGIRPTVKDRRPLVGKHADYSNVYIMNGLGTRGVMIAPYIAKELYNFIENKAELNPEININRFTL